MELAPNFIVDEDLGMLKTTVRDTSGFRKGNCKMERE